MPGDLGRQQKIDRPWIQRDFRVHEAQLVQGRDDAVPQRDVGLEQPADERLLRFGRTDPDEDRRQLATQVERRALVAERRLDVRNDRVPEARQRGRGVLHQLVSLEGRHQRLDQLLARNAYRQNRIAARATASSSSRMSASSRSMNESGTSAINRAASARSRAPFVPSARTMPSSSARAASRFCAGPGEARNAAMPARIEKSSKSPSC